MVREILQYPDSRLMTKCDPVEDPTSEMAQELATDLLDTVFAATGVGLAAPQLGVLQRMCVCYLEGNYWTLCNPKILMATPEIRKGEEGCLSIPGVGVIVERPVGLLIEYMDLEGETRELETTGFDSRVILHEMDHLDGILMWDRAKKARARLAKDKFKKILKRRARNGS